MPVLNPTQLFDVAVRVLEAVGVPAEDAAVVARELADANLVGHDSHGIMRLMQYAQMIRDGHVKPGSPLELVLEGPSHAVIDAHFSLGQVAAVRALEIAQAKAGTCGTATVMIRNCNHVGRLGSYTARAAAAGYAALMAVNSPGPGGVAPFGGIDRKLGTNPICLAAPGKAGALVLDMTTSATAEGKLRVAYQKGEHVGAGLLIDHAGQATNDPAAFYQEPGGAILPLGGPDLGHKGYGLSVMLDVFCGILSGSGVARTDLPRGANGVWLMLLQIEQFISRDQYDVWLERYVQHIKSSRRAPGVDEILLPGEIEERRQAERSRAGVKIPDETWRQISELARTVGATLPTV